MPLAFAFPLPPSSLAQVHAMFAKSTALLALLCTVFVAHAGERPLRQTIDAEMKLAWTKEKIKPAGLASDATFLRRVFLDLVGTIPTYDEAKAFLDDADPAKRDKLVDRLLDDPRFATQQAHVWDLVLFGRRPGNIDAVRKRDGFQRWLADQFAKNVPYDQWVRNLLLAEQDESGLFYVQHRNQPEEATVAVTRIFLGTQLQCARCHDHPYEAWTQRDFYGMAGFFVRLVVVEGEAGKGKRKYTIGEKSTGEVLFTGSAKEQRPGQKGEPIKPKFLGGKELAEPAVPKDFKEVVLKGSAVPPKPLFSRKEKLVDWLVSPDNPYFAKAAANRVWAQFMGRGVVHPIDDLSEKNEPSHPELLQALTKDLLARKFDLKGFIREIVRSDAYQLGDTGDVTDALPTRFERARVRPLSAEELMASLRTASGDAPNTKALGDPSEYFLRYFGEPTDGQGTFQGGLAEHLFLNNASQFRVFAQPRKGNLADWLVATKAPWEEKVDRLFLSVLSRLPRPEERKRFVAHLSSDAKMVPALVEESIWVLMSCAEFRFNH
jgi:hypothetical protein